MTWLAPHPQALVWLMLVAGLVGGFTSAVWSDGPLKEGILKRLSIGVLASFTVPLLLRTISSDLIATPKEPATLRDPIDYLVFLGFCLLAAYSAPAYLDKLTSRILKDLEEKVKKTVAMVDNAAKQIEATTAKDSDPT